MGLDISFELNKALEAGLQISNLEEDGRYELCLQVPGKETYIAAYLSIYDDIIDIQVRANKWGSSYAPLTEWLKEHNIEWSEF